MTIERITPGAYEWEAYYGNHIHRYAFAVEVLQTSKPKSVLDVACGSGYGTRYLHDRLGAQLTGVDIDQNTIELAQAAFGGDGIKYAIGNAESLPPCDIPFDAIVSFETIEHL